MRSAKTRGEYDSLKLEKIVRVMDRKNKGIVTYDSFMELFDILFLLKKQEKERAAARSVPSTLPMWRVRIYRVYQHKYYECSIYLLSIFSLLLLFWREYMDLYGDDSYSDLPAWVTICEVINFIFFFDLVFRFLYQGFWLPLKSFYALLEILFQALSISVLLLYCITLRYNYVITTLEFIILVRLVKLLQLLDELKTWKIILKALRHLVVPFATLFMVQMGIIYTYAIIGERIYGGKISYNSLGNLSSAGLGREYVMMNFNDLVSSIITMLYFSLAW